MVNVQQKIALVTGGSRGIGAGIARRLAEDGLAVAITFVQKEIEASAVVADISAAGGTAIAIKADAMNPSEISSAVDFVVNRFGSIDVLVNNNGYISYDYNTIEETPLDVIDKTLAINLRSAILYVQAVSHHIRDDGRIINIGSCLAQRVPGRGLALYAASKAGLTGLTKGLARDLGPRGITVNEIAPGPINTDMNPSNGPASDYQRGLTASGQYGKPGDIAALVSYLVRSEASFVTGAIIAADGGTNI